jgi:hypothetical protein
MSQFPTVTHDSTFDDYSMLLIVRFCAEEVDRQGDGPLAVYPMFVGYMIWANCQWTPDLIVPMDIVGLHRQVMPEGPGGWACVPRTFADGSRGEDPANIERAMNNLVSAITEGRVTADEAYQEFERIHPFVDGNGRVGAILWNWLNGTLDKPRTPPEFKRGA